MLSDNHLKEYAYTLLFHEDYPSWLYEVGMGATAIWERWNSVLPDGSVSGTGMNSYERTDVKRRGFKGTGRKRNRTLRVRQLPDNRPKARNANHPGRSGKLA